MTGTHHLPRACTDLAACPLPPAENRLPVAIEAGLRIPRERASTADREKVRPAERRGGLRPLRHRPARDHFCQPTVSGSGL